MSEILLTPRPEPISPIDPDVRPALRASSQSSEFFNSVFVDSVYSGTRPLKVVKKAAAGNIRSSTVSAPSSPVSLRSTDLHPHQTISKLFLNMGFDRNPSLSGHAHSDVALQDEKAECSLPSPPLTPVVSPTAHESARPVVRARSRPRMPLSPVTPSRAPAKALKLLGTQPFTSEPKAQKKRRDHFRAIPNASLVDIFGSGSKRPSRSISTKNLKLSAQATSDMRRPTAGYRVEDGAVWVDEEGKQEFPWLRSDPSIRGDRTDMGRYASDEEDWGVMALSNVVFPSRTTDKRVDESFVDLFGSAKVHKPKAPKPRLQGKGRPSAVPHPWSAAALSDTPPALVNRTAHSPDSGSSSSSGPPSPDTDTTKSPPRRPKKRPPPLVLDLKPKSNLPIIVLNSPPAHSNMKKPLTPIRYRQPSVQPAQTPFVHPRRAPKPIPRALDLATLPRSTDTRMPLLPHLPVVGSPEDEFPISVFEPVTPTDIKYPGHLGHDMGDRKGRWLKKVVRDFSHVKL